MTELLTAAQMRAIEQAAIDSGEVTGLGLMERAGQGVVDAIFAEWPELAVPAAGGLSALRAERETSLSRSPGYRESQRSKARRAVVLCGPGNNGGDGFVVARLLKEAGWAVEVFLYGDAEKLPPDARVNYERWCEMGEVDVLGMPRPTKQQADQVSGVIWGAGTDTILVIDALFGTGLSRPLGDLKEFIDECQLDGGASYSKQAPYIVSIDIPSGHCADSGRALGDSGELAIGAHLTVAFEFKKRGHFLSECAQASAKLTLIPLGLNRHHALQVINIWPSAINGVRRKDMTIAPRLVSRFYYETGHVSDLSWLDKDPKEPSHKYSHGHALVLSGGVGQGGAARLAARGALRVGAGAVTIGCPAAALPENAAQLNAIMLREVPDAAALAEVLNDRRLNAVCLGPGLGLGAREAALVDGMCKHAAHVVLDADALTLLARKDDPFAMLHTGCVLTPHMGEFARLFPDIADKLVAPATNGPAYSKVDATREAAQRAGCIVLFKGPDTVIADPDGRCSINASVYERAAPWLATAGSGDVLAGFITGLLARGFAPMQAAETGAWLHTECALRFGPGLIAEDLPEVLPKVFRKLGIT